MKTNLLFGTLLLGAHFLAAQTWTRLNTQGDIPARQLASATYNSRTGNLLLFGGQTNAGNDNEVWNFNTTSLKWDLIPSKGNEKPEGRFTHVAMYDSLLNRLLVFSGQGNGLYNDLWAFRFADSTWQLIFANGNVSGAPLQRYGTATGFDPISRKVLNFAGFTTSGRFDDTWTFDADEKTWADKTMPLFPIKRCLTTQCVASKRREMIVYAGQSTGDLDDIWSVNLDTYIWQNLTPATKPKGRHFSSVAYTENNQLLMFGGTGGGPLGDTWKFDLLTNQWIQLQSILEESPEARFGHVMAYSPDEHKTYLFGGNNGTTHLNDTWVLNTLTTGLEEEQNSQIRIKMGPNPVKDQLHLYSSIHIYGHFTLFTLLGEKVLQCNVSNSSPITVPSSLKTGTYLVRLEWEEGSYVQKIVKE